MRYFEVAKNLGGFSLKGKLVSESVQSHNTHQRCGMVMSLSHWGGHHEGDPLLLSADPEEMGCRSVVFWTYG